VKQSAEISSVG